ncbi:MAG: hypothetical protein ACWGQW_09260, partial [bacterium]
MAKKQIDIHKFRTNNILLKLGFDVSGDTFTSEIRKEEDPTSTLIATVDCNFATDGTDGQVILTVDDGDLANVTVT